MKEKQNTKKLIKCSLKEMAESFKDTDIPSFYLDIMKFIKVKYPEISSADILYIFSFIIMFTIRNMNNKAKEIMEMQDFDRILVLVIDEIREKNHEINERILNGEFKNGLDKS
jgi:hypothetical protein